MFFPFNGNLSSRFFWLAVSIAGVFLACGYGWKRLRPEFLQQPHFQVNAENVTINEVPAYFETDVKGEVLASLEAEPINLLDHDALQTIADAFLDHRCVAGIYSISKSAHGISCLLEFHQPIATIELIDKQSRPALVPVTASSIVMDPQDLKREVFENLIRVSVPGLVDDRMYAGEPFENSEVRDCLLIADEIQKELEDHNVVRILSVAGWPNANFQLQLKNGTRVFWGSAPQQELETEATPREKISALREVIEKYAQHQSETDFQDLDISSGKPRRVIPKTAAFRTN